MLTICGRRNSFNVQKVIWLVGELGLDHAHVPLGGAFGGLDDPQFRARNPHGRIPVIDDEGVIVWESHAILRYLAARHGGERFWPADPAARSYPDRWMDWAQIDAAAGLRRRRVRRLLPHAGGKARLAGDPRRRRALRASLRISRSAGSRTGPSSPATMLTLADIPAGTTLYRYFELDIERPSLPNVEAWYARLAERPAYRQHVMVPFARAEGGAWEKSIERHERAAKDEDDSRGVRRLGRRQPGRYELVDGEVFAQASERVAHAKAKLAARIGLAGRRAPRRRALPCSAGRHGRARRRLHGLRARRAALLRAGARAGRAARRKPARSSSKCCRRRPDAMTSSASSMAISASRASRIISSSIPIRRSSSIIGAGRGAIF